MSHDHLKQPAKQENARVKAATKRRFCHCPIILIHELISQTKHLFS